jgi:hypothetical protein
MKSRFNVVNSLIIAILASCFASTAIARTDLLWTAIETKQQIDERLEDCGTSILHPDDPRLPFRQVPAHEALANMDVRYLFGYYYRTSGFGGTDFVWKRPNGGMVARMTVRGDSHLSFTLSHGGQQAHMNSYVTPSGEGFNYWCNSRQVNERGFRLCVENRWVQQLLNGFCAR